MFYPFNPLDVIINFQTFVLFIDKLDLSIQVASIVYTKLYLLHIYIIYNYYVLIDLDSGPLWGPLFMIMNSTHCMLLHPVVLCSDCLPYQIPPGICFQYANFAVVVLHCHFYNMIREQNDYVLNLQPWYFCITQVYRNTTSCFVIYDYDFKVSEPPTRSLFNSKHLKH